MLKTAHKCKSREGVPVMVIETFEQYSDEWWAARVGIPTASCFGQIITPKTMQPSKQAERYLYTLAGERIVGRKAETYQTAAMERGLLMEEKARSMLEMVLDAEISQVGLVYPDDKKRYSCSPDGMMVTAGVEIKCPNLSTHVGYLLNGNLPVEYIPQVQGSMLVTGFYHWLFCSYYPGISPLIIYVERDDKFCAKLKIELDDFCERLDEVEIKLKDMQ
jgi:hypothetical protein